MSTVLELEPRPIRVDEYHRMIEVGILSEEDKVELIEGVIEGAGLGGFSQFVRAEARGSWYLGAPRWLLDRSTFVLGTFVTRIIGERDEAKIRRRSEELHATQRQTAPHPQGRQRVPATGLCHPVELMQSNQDRKCHKQEEVKGGSELNQQEKGWEEDDSTEDPFQMHITQRSVVSYQLIAPKTP